MAHLSPRAGAFVRQLIAVCIVACTAWRAPDARAVDLRDVLTGYTYTSWSRKDGLVGPVWAIAQDGNGFLWLGTDAALVRFDGVRFMSWEGLGGQPLPRLPIRALFVAPSGALWVGFGGSGGLARIDSRAVTTFVESEGVGSMGTVTAIIEDAEGTPWASAATGLYRFAHDRWVRVSVAEGLPQDTAVNAFIDRTGALWVSTIDALFRRDTPSGGPFERVEPAPDPQRTVALSQAPDGRLWATDSLVGFRAIGEGPDLRSTEAGRGYRLLHDRDGNLWVATIGQGLWRVTLPPGSQRPVVERTTVLSGLSSDAVRTVFEDRDGNIWAGTTEGVDRLVPHRVTPWTGLGLVNTIDVASDGRVWAGTADGLIQFVRDGSAWHPSDSRLPIRAATAIRGAATGGLWVTTASALYRVHGPSIVQVPAPKVAGELSIEALAADADGEAWIVTTEGEILKTEKGVLRPNGHVPELRGVRTNAALVDATGNLWVLFRGNRIGVRTGEGEFRTFGEAGLGNSPHFDIYEDEASAIWVCGADGLSRFTGDRFVFVGRANGLPGAVYSIAQDERDDLWLATSSGIVRLDPEEFDRALKSPQYVMRFRIYDTSDGLAGYPVTLGDRNAVRAGDGSLWFVTSRGISVADPRRLTTQRLPPLVAIDETRADDVRLLGNELPPGTSKLEVEYTAPELTSPLKTRFRYRLEGLDADWIDAGTRREALYTNLPPRSYTFRVAVSQDDGRWSEAEATWAFTLRPRFYQTRWFVGVVALTIAGVTWGTWRMRVRQLRRQFAMVLGERVRLSRELHDTLLQSLVGVALEFDAVSKSLETSPSTARQRVIKIREQVEEYIREARRSIWSLRSPALETGDLIEALRDSATRAVAGHPIDLTFEQGGERRRLPSHLEHQLLRIGQEALLNAVRHSGASTITIGLQYDPDSVSLTIADNGHGFDAARAVEASTDHYGLMTMRERAEQAGGQLRITSGGDAGTRVEAVIPIRQESDGRQSLD